MQGKQHYPICTGSGLIEDLPCFLSLQTNSALVLPLLSQSCEQHESTESMSILQTARALFSYSRVYNVSLARMRCRECTGCWFGILM